MSSPMDQVFATTELLEKILLSLPDSKPSVAEIFAPARSHFIRTLHALQRVNRHFRDVIRSSPRLRRDMFTDTSSSSSSPAETPSPLPTDIQILHINPVLYLLDLPRAAAQNHFLQTGNVWFWFSGRELNRGIGSGDGDAAPARPIDPLSSGSWRDMQLLRTPFPVTLQTSSDRYGFTSPPAVRFGARARPTLGEVADVIMEGEKKMRENAKIEMGRRERGRNARLVRAFARMEREELMRKREG